MTQEYDELLQDVLDGVATPGQRARLEELEARDPALRRRREQMAHAFQVLTAARQVEPPAGMREETVRALPLRRALPARGALPKPPARPLRWLVPVAVSLAVALLLWGRASKLTEREADLLMGTMGAAEGAGTLTLGSMGASVTLVALPDPKGFRLVARSAAEAVLLAVSPLTPGVTLREGDIRHPLRAHESREWKGTRGPGAARFAVTASFSSGGSASGELELPPAPTSASRRSP